MNESVLINFGQFIGMEADELAAMDLEDRQLLLKKLLACQLAPHEPEVAQYICANLDFDGVQQMHEQTQGECWTLGKHDPLPPAVLHDIFTNAALVDKNEAYQRFKEKIGTGVEDARALKLFHALHLPNLRAIVLHTVDNDIVMANELHDKLLYYKREVEGPKRMVIREELNDLLVAGISFDPKVFTASSAEAEEAEEQPPRAEAVPLVKVVPIASEAMGAQPSWSDGDESELRGVLKPFYKLAGLPLNFSARDAAKQFVLLTRSSEVPDSVLEPLLHRDQIAVREKFAQHMDESHRDTLYQKAMEPVASAIFASPAGEASIAENAMCIHFYNTLPKDERKQEYTAKQFFSKFFIENEQPVGKFWIKQIADAKF